MADGGVLAPVKREALCWRGDGGLVRAERR